MEVQSNKKTTKVNLSKVPLGGASLPKGLVSGNETATIVKKEDVPHNFGVLSATGGALQLREDWQNRYAILLTNKEKKFVDIVISSEIDKDKSREEYFTITDQIRRSGYNRARRWQAKPEIIRIIYDESAASSLSREEQEKQATEIQMQFDELIATALSQDVSDIHIEVRRDEAKVRFRKNGDLFDFTPWSVRYARTMAGVIYQVIADEKDTTFNEMTPQDAIIDRDIGNGRIRVRLATIPAYPSGFDMIMRILRMGASGARRSLESLGYNHTQLGKVRRAVAKPVGAVVMAGTTGSGKSTSLNSMLGEKIEEYEGSIKVITVEDPPEYQLAGATQSPVVRSRSKAQSGDKAANPFSAVVRAAMRSDPDILMVGEVRDEASAELLIHAVESGHQVFTTVHASSALGIAARMRSNGVPDDILGSPNFFSALMYQTLLPTVCPKCSTDILGFAKKIKSDNDYELLERIYTHISPQDAKRLRFKNDDGCEHCKEGVVGRSVAAEIIIPDAHILKCFRERRDAEAIYHYRHKGGRIALDHGLYKAFMGLCDIRDVEQRLDRITYLDEIRQGIQIQVLKSEVIDTTPSVIHMADLLEGEDIRDAETLKKRRQTFMNKLKDYIVNENNGHQVQQEISPDVEAQKEVQQKASAPQPAPVQPGPAVEDQVPTPVEPTAAESEVKPEKQEAVLTEPEPKPAKQRESEPAFPTKTEPQEVFRQIAQPEVEPAMTSTEPKSEPTENGQADNEALPEAQSANQPTKDAPPVDGEGIMTEASSPAEVEVESAHDSEDSQNVEEQVVEEPAEQAIASAEDKIYEPEPSAVSDEAVLTDAEKVMTQVKESSAEKSAEEKGISIVKGIFTKASSLPKVNDLVDKLGSQVERIKDSGILENVLPYDKASTQSNVFPDNAEEVAESAESLAVDPLAVNASRIVNIVAACLAPELERNKLKLTERFLNARLSDGALDMLLGKEEVPSDIRNELQELISDIDTMGRLRSYSSKQLFAMVSREEESSTEETGDGIEFKSSLLNILKKPGAKAEVESLEQARKKRLVKDEEDAEE